MSRTFAAADTINFGDIDALDGLSALSVSCWVKIDASSAAFAGLVSKETGTTGWGLLWYNGGTNNALLCNAKNGSNSANRTQDNTLIAGATWRHLMYVYDGSLGTDQLRMKAWIDGVSQSMSNINANIPASMAANSQALAVGQEQADVFTNLVGNVAEIGIWPGVAISDQPTISAIVNGVNLFKVRPDVANRIIIPLWGLHSPEIAFGTTSSGTLTGTSRGNHPPVVPFTRRIGG